MELGMWKTMFEELDVTEIITKDVQFETFVMSLHSPKTELALKNVPEEMLVAFCDVVALDLEGKYRFDVKVPAGNIPIWRPEETKGIIVSFSNRFTADEMFYMHLWIFKN